MPGSPGASLAADEGEERLDPERLVGEFHDRIAGYVRMRVPAGDCDDVVAEIFLRAVERIGQMRGDALGWLFAVARSRVAQYYRERKAGMTVVSQSAPEAVAGVRAADPGGLGALERLEREEFCGLVRRTMMQILSDEERDAIALKFTDGLTNVQIAGILGVTPGALGVMLHRALGRLRRAMLEEVADVVPGRA
jgi:RNA polymerase sigma-70 factor (ECF subfamily)